MRLIENRLAGTIIDIRYGSAVTHLRVRSGAQILKSIVPTESATGLHVGDAVILKIKATNVEIETAARQSIPTKRDAAQLQDPVATQHDGGPLAAALRRS